MLKDKLQSLRASAQDAFSVQNLMHGAAVKLREAIDTLPQDHGPSPVDVEVSNASEGGYIVWNLKLAETIDGQRHSRPVIRVLLSPTGKIRQREIKRTPDGKHVSMDHDEWFAQVIYCAPKLGRETGEWVKDAKELGDVLERLINSEDTARICWCCLEQGPAGKLLVLPGRAI